MRRWLMGAICAAMTCAPVNAASVTYVDSELQQFGLQKFDTNLGILQKATLTVTASKYRFFQVFAPTGTDALSVDWEIDGLYNTYFLWGVTSEGSGSLFMPLRGAGSSAITLSPLFGDRVTGYFSAAISGSMSYRLDNETVSSNGWDYFLATGNDLGYYPGGDAIVTGSGPFSFRQLSANCGGRDTGDDFCGSVSYRVTYDYSPTDGVPEPSTWAMLIFGFGAVGAAMRRRSLAAAMPGV